MRLTSQAHTGDELRTTSQTVRSEGTRLFRRPRCTSSLLSVRFWTDRHAESESAQKPCPRRRYEPARAGAGRPSPSIHLHLWTVHGCIWFTIHSLIHHPDSRHVVPQQASRDSLEKETSSLSKREKRGSLLVSQ